MRLDKWRYKERMGRKRGDGGVVFMGVWGVMVVGLVSWGGVEGEEKKDSVRLGMMG